MVERAQPNVTVARPAQMDRPAYHFDNVDRLLYKSGNSGTRHSASLLWAKKEAAT
jgi:hypothetical protein